MNIAHSWRERLSGSLTRRMGNRSHTASHSTGGLNMVSFHMGNLSRTGNSRRNRTDNRNRHTANLRRNRLRNHMVSLRSPLTGKLSRTDNRNRHKASPRRNSRRNHTDNLSSRRPNSHNRHKVNLRRNHTDKLSSRRTASRPSSNNPPVDGMSGSLSRACC